MESGGPDAKGKGNTVVIVNGHSTPVASWSSTPAVAAANSTDDAGVPLSTPAEPTTLVGPPVQTGFAAPATATFPPTTVVLRQGHHVQAPPMLVQRPTPGVVTRLHPHLQPQHPPHPGQHLFSQPQTSPQAHRQHQPVLLASGSIRAPVAVATASVPTGITPTPSHQIMSVKAPSTAQVGAPPRETIQATASAPILSPLVQTTAPATMTAVVPFQASSSQVSMLTVTPRPSESAFTLSGSSVSVAASPSKAPGGGHESPKPKCRDVGDTCEGFEWISWTPEYVANWVEKLLGEGVGDPFLRHAIDGPTLMGLTDAELKEPLGLQDSLQRIKLLGHVRAIQLRCHRPRRSARAGRLPHKAPAGIAGSNDADPIMNEEIPGADVSTRESSPNSRRAIPKQRVESPFLRTGPGSPHVAHSRQTAGSAASNPAHCTAGMSRSQSAASSICSQSFANTSRYSKVTGGRSGPGSTFGAESPSDSIFGTFTKAQRSRHKVVSPIPGPSSYNPAEAERVTTRHSSSSRATIGKSPRKTPYDSSGHPLVECAGTHPGPMSYDPHRADTSMSSTPVVPFGKTPRWYPRPGTEDTIRAPGPGSYNVDSAPSRSPSPRPTMGKSTRDTTEFIVHADPICAAPTPSRCGSAARLNSPRVRGGVIGTSHRMPRTPERPRPGPGTYEQSHDVVVTQSVFATIGNACRNTSEYLVGKETTSTGHVGPRGRARGCVIGSAPRWSSPGSRHQSSSPPPGPQTYDPIPTALSTLR